MRFYGYAVLRLYGFTVIRFYGYAVVLSWEMFSDITLRLVCDATCPHQKRTKQKFVRVELSDKKIECRFLLIKIQKDSL